MIDGRLDEASWRDAPGITDFHFNWWKEGAKEPTVAKLLWDEENPCLGFYVHDNHISAEVVKQHGPVSLDDCIEVFISPDVSKPRSYYSFEINAIGTMLNGPPSPENLRPEEPARRVRPPLGSSLNTHKHDVPVLMKYTLPDVSVVTGPNCWVPTPSACRPA